MKSEDELRRILNTYPRDELRKVIAGTNITNVSKLSKPALIELMIKNQERFQDVEPYKGEATGLRAILETYPRDELRKVIGKSNITNVNKLSKPQLIETAMKYQERFQDVKPFGASEPDLVVERPEDIDEGVEEVPEPPSPPPVKKSQPKQKKSLKPLEVGEITQAQYDTLQKYLEEYRLLFRTTPYSDEWWTDKHDIKIGGAAAPYFWMFYAMFGSKEKDKKYGILLSMLMSLQYCYYIGFKSYIGKETQPYPEYLSEDQPDPLRNIVLKTAGFIHAMGSESGVPKFTIPSEYDESFKFDEADVLIEGRPCRAGLYKEGDEDTGGYDEYQHDVYRWFFMPSGTPGTGPNTFHADDDAFIKENYPAVYESLIEDYPNDEDKPVNIVAPQIVDEESFGERFARLHPEVQYKGYYKPKTPVISFFQNTGYYKFSPVSMKKHFPKMKPHVFSFYKGCIPPDEYVKNLTGMRMMDTESEYRAYYLNADDPIPSEDSFSSKERGVFLLNWQQDPTSVDLVEGWDFPKYGVIFGDGTETYLKTINADHVGNYSYLKYRWDYSQTQLTLTDLDKYFRTGNESKVNDLTLKRKGQRSRFDMYREKPFAALRNSNFKIPRIIAKCLDVDTKEFEVSTYGLRELRGISKVDDLEDAEIIEQRPYEEGEKVLRIPPNRKKVNV